MNIEIVKIVNDGYLVNGKIFVPKADGNRNYKEIKQWIENGGVVEPEFTESELNQQAILYFTSKTTLFIQSKIEKYNMANGTAFSSVHNCESYSRIDGYTHQIFCQKVWAWSVNIWETARAYQESAAEIPTDTEFQSVLDGVSVTW